MDANAPSETPIKNPVSKSSRNESVPSRTSRDMMGDLETLARALAQDQNRQANLADVSKQLNRIRESNHDRNRLLKSLAELLQRVSGAELVLLCRSERSDDEQVKTGLFRLAGKTAEDEQVLRTEFLQAHQAAVTSQEGIHRPSQLNPRFEVYSIAIPKSENETLVARVPSGADRRLIFAWLYAAATQVTVWDERRLARERSQETEQLSAMTDLVSRIESSENETHAANVVSNLMTTRFSNVAIAIGLRNPRRPELKLAAISGKVGIDPRSEEKRLIEAAMQECVVRGEVGRWPSTSADRHALLAHQQLAVRMQLEALAVVPLCDTDGAHQGAIMIHGESARSVEEATRFVHAASIAIASSLRLLRRAKKSWLARSIVSVNDSLRTRKGIVVLSSLLALAGALCVPVPYRIQSDIELEPISRRYVTAPFEAPLQQGLVVAGDIVEQDTVLAELDGRELRWELAGLEAELDQAIKEHSGYLASHETGEAEIARLEIERLRQRVLLVENRIENLQVKSPIPGMVVSGDLSKNEGMPLQVGETLFEIAPLDSMIVNILVPEEDIRHCGVGSKVWLTMDAFPGRRWEATLRTIHPRAEIIDDQNVFVAEVELTNEGALLRPGMRGGARIDGGRHPLGWNLFHKATNSVLNWIGW